MLDNNEAELHDDFMPLLAQRQQDPKSEHSLDQGVVPRVLLNTKEDAMHDDFTPLDTHGWANNNVSIH